MTETFAEWARKGIEKYEKAMKFATKKGEDIYKRLWIADNQPKSKEGWISLIEEMNEFINNPDNPQEDKDKISDVYEGAAMIAIGYFEEDE